MLMTFYLTNSYNSYEYNSYSYILSMCGCRQRGQDNEGPSDYLFT